ncbi:MAG: alpha/beta hydrolase family protein [Acidimicrobiales bacterium]
MLELLDNEQLAPKVGLTITDHDLTSAPDGNTVKLRLLRPEGDEPLPCVYYIHGGGMQSMSALSGMYQTWGRLLAHQGVAVAMIDFRNALTPSSRRRSRRRREPHARYRAQVAG